MEEETACLEPEKENFMGEMTVLLGVLAVWVLLQSVVLPRLGVSS